MESKSPSTLTKQVEGQVFRLLRQVELYKLAAKERNTIVNLQQELADAKIYTRDYELSETREEQLENAGNAKKHLDKARRNILLTSQAGLFEPADVAQLSAEIDQVISDLK